HYLAANQEQMKYAYATFLILLSSFLYAQDLHTPAEILEIMDKSELTYNIGLSEDPFFSVNRDENLNYNYFYRVTTDTSLQTNKYDPYPITLGYLHEAEEYFNNNQCPEARERYLKAMEHDPGHHMALTYIGQTYGIEKEYDKAIEYYQK